MNSQDYNQAIGYRQGYATGFSYKIYVDDETALEAFAGFKNRGMHFSIFKLKHKPANWRKNDKLFLYTGFGGHTGFYGRYDSYHFYSPVDHSIRSGRSFVVIGLDGVVGAEYRFIKYPFSVSLDYNPFFDLFGPNYFNLNLSNFCLEVKYNF
ncbi:MAG: hypothetical protein A2W91_14100 [Bacteroidetes bacterium GWF2_38_335]|nr:MAG: hypothetical protein A2W91_14100 [Bacteroidetes bacterium GWF2_38_335]OFY77846.1 MAG: hypothetical protein A2281_15790 [Bacteroidetes bacterium RIFOXYA12_FULL_38_20]HBS87345.1 hypothetical protein [Bacteroidales bacterium]